MLKMVTVRVARPGGHDFSPGEASGAKHSVKDRGFREWFEKGSR